MTTANNPLLQALNDLGFVYEVRYSAQGSPYAGLRWESVPARALRAFTALYEAGALRLTLYAPLGAGERLDATTRLERVAELPLVRLERGENYPEMSNLTLALPLEAEELTPALVRALLAHLASAGDWLVADEHDGTGALAWPRVAGTPGAAVVETALSSLGLGWRVDEGRDGRVIDMGLPGLGVPGSFVVTTVDGGWVRVLARLRCGSALTRARTSDDLTDRLQQWAPVGRFVHVVGDGVEQLAVEVAAPLVCARPEDALAQALRSAVQLLGTAHKQAPVAPT
jgi:hypothetical protein